jgi:aspartyl-tRNA(Asn)/glutamyl-tRNA(Gln) amidotransferase subunit C
MSEFNLKRIAHLARLHFDDRELKILESQVADILKYIEQLKEVDLSDVEPTSHPLPISNVFRQDQALPPLDIKEFLKNSPKSKDTFFEVPKVIEESTPIVP